LLILLLELKAICGLRQETPSLLAVGGHLKSVVTLAKGLHGYQSQHPGDLESVSSLEFLAEAMEHFERIFQIAPEYVVHDLHPEYASTAWALRQAQPKIEVQHHHAHIAGCMAKHGLRGPVIVLALDGTGYGVDGCVWGGEVLIASLTGFERFAHLKYVATPDRRLWYGSPGGWRLDIFMLRCGDCGRRPMGDTRNVLERGSLSQSDAHAICV
jgi:hydrogenase maturation protein HypF